MIRTCRGDIAPITRTWPFRAALRTLELAAVLVVAQIAYGQSGVVTSGGQPIPGATITARNGDAKVTTSTDRGGHYSFANLSAGVWTFEATMIGFSAQRKTVADPKPASVVDFRLALVQRERPGSADGAQRRGEDAPQTQPETLAPESTPTTPADSNEAFLVSGSLAQPFPQSASAEPGIGDRTMGGQVPPGAQIPGETGGGPPSAARGFGGGGGRGPGGPGPFAGGPRGGGRFPGRGPGGPPRRTEFGNRRASNPQIRGMIFGTLGNSALNAKPYSINGRDVVQPAYAQARFGVVLGGPLVIPKLLHNSSTFFSLNYFATRAKNPFSATTTVPTAQERTGDFSAIPSRIYDASTRAPFPGNVVPVSRISPIALGLLPYIPLPNHIGMTNNFMYQTSVAQDTDNLSARLQRNIRRNDRLAYQFNYQRRDGVTAQPFGFLDQSDGTGWNTSLSWTHNFSAALLNTARVSVNRNVNELVPYFANGENIAAELGIAGTSSNPINFGPPNLSFTNFGALSDGTPVLTRNQSQSVNESLEWVRGSHSITIGGQFGRNDLNTRTDQDGRGSMNFTGLATSVLGAHGQPRPETGFDFADFLLGFPQSASIRFGEANTYFRQNVFSAFAQDEWKAGPSLTLTYGLRYEYFSPLQEKYGRIANLDIVPGFSTVAVVTPDTTGPYSGVFPTGLVDPDRNNFSPRLGLAWKIPKMRRSTVLRLGYGIYYNGQAYNQFGARLSQQPPFAKSNSLNTSLTDVLTLADAFISTSPDEITNTYAVDRRYRTPYAQTWSVAVQHELPAGFFTEIGYVGTKGTRLELQLAPNTGPDSLLRREQVGNAVGFTFDTSFGNSIYHALQARLQRRFRNGISMTTMYTFSKSIDDSSTFGGVGNTVAQNWLDFSAERGLSSFDRRHVLSVNWVWTSPVGGSRSRLAINGWAKRALEDWQISGGVTAETGTPLTARVLGNGAQLAQTNGVGSGRADATGEAVTSGSGFFNRGAFTLPPPGEFGNAGRNTIPGPGMVSVNAAFGRSFQFGESRRRLELRLEGRNVLNSVNITNVTTVVNSINYGLPISAGAMRSLTAVVRFRF